MVGGGCECQEVRYERRSASNKRGEATDQITNCGKQRPITQNPPPVASIVCLVQGSFLPVPDLSVFGDSEESISLGEVLTPEGEELEINKGRATLSINVTNMGDRPIQVKSWCRVCAWACVLACGGPIEGSCTSCPRTCQATPQRTGDILTAVLLTPFP